MTTNEVIEQSKEVIKEVEDSIDRMRDLTSLSSLYISNSRQIDKHWTIIKGIFVLILLVIVFIGFAGATMWYHIQLDEERFDSLKNVVVVTKERQDFLITWQKSMQEQIVQLHPPK